MMSKDFKTGFLIGAVVTLIIGIILSQTVWKREGFQTAALSTMTDLYGRDFNIVAFPRGMILMWSGSVTEIPRGWALCDGTNGTPDLRGRFVLGVESGQSIGYIGGANSQTLNLGQLPSHTHGINSTTDAMRLTAGGRIPQWATSVSGGLGQAAASVISTAQATGTATGTISTMPPFYSLAYIMKL